MLEIKVAGNVKHLDVKHLEGIVLNLCGGGYTVAQTAKAMELCEKVRMMQMVKIGKVSIKIIVDMV